MTYPAATLNWLTAKKKWYVYVTIPVDLRAAFGGDRQIRRSTATADKREAQRMLHGIADAIYKQLDVASEGIESAKPHPLAEALQRTHSRVRLKLPAGFEDFPKGAIASIRDEEALSELANATTAQLESLMLTDPEQEYDDLAVAITEAQRAARTPLDLTGMRSFSSIIEDYFATVTFNRLQVRKQSELALQEFNVFLENSQIDEINAVVIYRYAQFLNDRGLAYNTIRGRIDKVSLAINHAIRKGWMKLNPCLGLKIESFGKARETYIPLTDDEVKQLFSLEMPPQHRLLLQCLTMTGARLDEIALLIWDEVEQVNLPDGTAATFFNLTKRPKMKKNKGSLRYIPIHPGIPLPNRGNPQERLFDCFRTNKDGKTIRASEILMKHIRKVTKDKLKVVHSLRHRFKDRMRDAGVTKEVNDFLTGHKLGDVAGGYGSGPSFTVRFEAISKLSVTW